MENKTAAYAKEEDSKANEENNSIVASYYEKLVKLERTGLLTSFGKMILSKNDTRPQYTFGRTKRCSPNLGKTDYLYRPTAEHNYKYYKSPGWGFGTSAKSTCLKAKYDFYNQLYNSNCDTNQFARKWKTIGGDIGNSLKSNKTFREGSPGPGRYNPNLKVIKYNSPAYLMGARLYNTQSLMNKTGTNPGVSPCSYELENRSSRHKFPFSPHFSIGKDRRKDNILPKHSTNETYLDYSSIGQQTISPKCSEPKMSFTKAPRFQSSHMY